MDLNDFYYIVWVGLEKTKRNNRVYNMRFNLAGLNLC